MKKILILLLVLVAFSCERLEELGEKETALMEERNALLEAGKHLEDNFIVISRTDTNGIGSIKIILDKSTGVKYLYVWGGAGNGGPAITRYWE